MPVTSKSSVFRREPQWKILTQANFPYAVSIDPYHVRGFTRPTVAGNAEFVERITHLLREPLGSLLLELEVLLREESLSPCSKKTRPKTDKKIRIC